MTEAWNRTGNKLIPKLRATTHLRVEVNASGTVESPSATAFADEVEQIIQDLGLQGKLCIATGAPEPNADMDQTHDSTPGGPI